MKTQETKGKFSKGSALVWIVMAILAGATAAWVVWASRQPEVSSMWAPN
jgi:hypothetical protein